MHINDLYVNTIEYRAYLVGNVLNSMLPIPYDCCISGMAISQFILLDSLSLLGDGGKGCFCR